LVEEPGKAADFEESAADIEASERRSASVPGDKGRSAALQFMDAA
jgi:hypothetical protein